MIFMGRIPTKIRVNGRVVEVAVDAQWSLLGVLRDQLGLTGTKYGCGEGQCGACTVLINGAAKRSCRTPVGVVGNSEVTTIEGLASGENLHALQQAFLDEGAMQCAYCTSGMIMSATALLNSNRAPAVEDIAQAMEGNICRCGTYLRIVAAIQRAAKTILETRP